MLGRQLVDDAGRRRVGDVEPRLRVGGGAPDRVERPAAALRDPDARILRAAASAAARAGRARREPVDHDVVQERLAAGHPQDRGGARVGRAREHAKAADDRPAALRRQQHRLRLADAGERLDAIGQIDPRRGGMQRDQRRVGLQRDACRGRRRCRTENRARECCRRRPAVPCVSSVLPSPFTPSVRTLTHCAIGGSAGQRRRQRRRCRRQRLGVVLLIDAAGAVAAADEQPVVEAPDAVGGRRRAGACDRCSRSLANDRRVDADDALGPDLGERVLRLVEDDRGGRRRARTARPSATGCPSSPCRC